MKRRKEKQRSELALASKPQLADAKLQHASCERREKKNNASKLCVRQCWRAWKVQKEEQYLETSTWFIHIEEGTKKSVAGGGGIFYGVPYRLKYNSLMDKAT